MPAQVPSVLLSFHEREFEDVSYRHDAFQAFHGAQLQGCCILKTTTTLFS
jgi:hypothetical protein